LKSAQFSVRTTAKVQLVNIDQQVQDVIKKSGVKDGICTVFVPHTTAGVTINENADPDVVRDMVMETNKIIPFQDGYYHNEGNSAAHIKSSLYGPSQNLIIDDGKIVYGTWQSIYFCEFDGPRTRKVIVKIIEG
jgi:secondary thiamine-phosphate synthase enzyme